ncbi:CFEM domain-containing protein [Emericellopsis atlantica]|uniref:CFEM domain-containing protein n=1 Tax=Emericellopsis atlantica TaxID=2614577 RepID=A0A9P7ZTT6_9HYPO|nr:CFEM domain-containing protein [Emericellopsis atlantica]KAG9257508.1 CFEM domain-containing protein [Emericellopsis atlantica]
MRVKSWGLSHLALLLVGLVTLVRADIFSSLAKLPSCGTECFQSSLAESTCGLNVTCICADKTFHDVAFKCILGTCSVRDALEVGRVEAEACERPVRSRRQDILIPLAAYLPAWIAPWLRLYSRWTTCDRLAIDDYMMSICAIFYVDESFYLFCLSLTKVSMIFFYLRVFPNRGFRYAAFATMAFVIIPTVVLIFAQIFQCSPIHYVWDGWVDGSQADHCININALAYTAASFSIAQELVLLVLPLPLLIGLNMGLKQKAGIILMFSLGVFVVITSCVRLRYIVSFGHTVNPSWDLTDPLIWSGIEVSVSIIIACLPAIRVLIIRVIPGLLSSLGSRGPSNKNGYVKEGSGFSAQRSTNSRNKLQRRRSANIFSSRECDVDDDGNGNGSEVELGLQLGDKIRGNVQTEIYGAQDTDSDKADQGIRINTTTRVDVHEFEMERRRQS